MSGHTPWSQIKHKSDDLSLMRLSSTDWKPGARQEYAKLARLKMHFSLLCDEKDEVNKFQVNYYRSDPNVLHYLIFALVLLLGMYLLLKVR